MTNPGRPRFNTSRRALSLLFALLAAGLLASLAQAKDNPVTAIALFDGPSGPAYTQVNGLLLNGKSELRVCDGVPRMDKPTYDNLAKTQLAGAAFLERTQDGALMLNTGGK